MLLFDFYQFIKMSMFEVMNNIRPFHSSFVIKQGPMPRTDLQNIFKNLSLTAGGKERRV